MILIKQVEKDLLVLGLVSTSGYKLSKVIANYDKDLTGGLFVANFSNEYDTNDKIKDLANECYDRLKKKFKNEKVKK